MYLIYFLNNLKAFFEAKKIKKAQEKERKIHYLNPSQCRIPGWRDKGYITRYKEITH